ncbi:ATP-binding protein [Actinomadura terrae]|uniref:ATP-binding protein n=1 Tax=Actinomadura terrae TaxID=604353 RepID=UPI001FA77F19|nr:tetratricopeptide repeat protein [Actinomadura terrae]
MEVDRRSGAPRPALHRAIFCVDIEGFGDWRRTNADQLTVRAALYAALRRAFTRAGVAWDGDEIYREDRGDGALILVSPEVPKHLLAAVVPQALADELAEHNRHAEPQVRLRVRVALHAGEVHRDDHGVAATSINFSFRLLEAAPLKEALRESSGTLVLIASEWFYTEVVWHDRADAALYRRVLVSVKETRAHAWICRPDDPYPPQDEAPVRIVAPGGEASVPTGASRDGAPGPTRTPQNEATVPTGMSRDEASMPTAAPSDEASVSSAAARDGGPGPSGAPQVAVPRQLPAAISGFAGRAEELKSLALLLEQAAMGGTVVISAIQGTAGIGKTTLAVYWAHQVTDHFPDGHLYVNLRGFDPSGTPMTSAEAVRGFLDAFQVPPERVPVSLDAQAALYRSLLAGRRVLVLLDNAYDSDHVRPLLPGSPGCLAMVTSRNRLTSLVTAEGARLLPLDLLSPDEARELLAHRLGTERLEAEPDAVGEIVEMCARLPLALAIVAARATAHPRFPLSALARELREAQGGLDAFEDGELATDVRAVLSWSYRALSPGAARLFRLVSVHPGPDIDPRAAASLAGEELPVARRLLAELSRTHLLEESSPGRLRFHDLLRAYAAEQALREDDEGDRRDALERVLDHYLHTGIAANQRLYPHRVPIALDEPHHGVTLFPVADPDQAMAWFTAERAPLLAAIEHAAAHGFDVHAWQLSWTLATFFDRQGHWHDAVTAQRTALAAATRLGDRVAQARTHRQLGRAHARLGQPTEAAVHHEHALSLFQELGDSVGQGVTHLTLSTIYGRHGRNAEALVHAQRTLELSRAADNAVWRARALNSLGWNHALLGGHERGLEYSLQALRLHLEFGDRVGEAASLDSLGYAYHGLGRYEEAVDHYLRSIRLWRELDGPYEAADALNRLSETHSALGDVAAARDCLLEALAIFEELRHPDAATTRDRLRLLGLEPPPPALT